MTTPQTLTNDDAALGIIQLTIVHSVLGQAVTGDLPTDAIGSVAETLGGALDEILTITDGVNLPHADLDQAVGLVRSVRTQLAQVQEHAGALTTDTVQRLASTLRDSLGQAISLTQPYARGGNPERSPHRRDALTGGNLVADQTDGQQTEDNPLELPWLTGQTPPTGGATLDELFQAVQQAARGVGGQAQPPQVPQARREMMQPPQRPQTEPTQAFSEGQQVYVLDGGVPRPGHVQLLRGATFVILDD